MKSFSFYAISDNIRIMLYVLYVIVNQNFNI